MKTIYILICPLVGRVRYIGQSDDVTKRLRAHLNEAASGTKRHHRARWLAKVLRAGMKPHVVEVIKVPADFQWQHFERFMIASARHFGTPITNSTAGGEGVEVIDESVRERMRTHSRRKMDDPEFRANFLRHSKEWRESEEGKTYLCGFGKRIHSDPEAAARNLVKLREANARPEVWANKNRANKEKGATQEYRAAVSAGAKRRFEDPDQRAMASAAHSARWADPQWRAKTTTAVRASRTAIGFSERMSAAQKAAHQNPEFNERFARARSPEANAKRSASLRATWALRKAESTRRAFEWDTA